MDSIIPDVKSLHIPVKYLTNLLTAGDEAPVTSALERMLAMHTFKRAEVVHGRAEPALLEGLNLTPAQVEEMYQTMAIANYEDRFVVPSSHKEQVEDSFNDKGSCGFTFGNGCSGGASEGSLFGKKPQGSVMLADMLKSHKKRRLYRERNIHLHVALNLARLPGTRTYRSNERDRARTKTQDLP